MTSVIVLAGGTGSRLGSPKQFLDLAPGQRLVDVAVKLAREVGDQVILGLPVGAPWDGARVDQQADAGASRIASVANALAKVDPATDIVVVHDAAHPLASPALMLAVIDAVRAGADAAFPLLPATDVIKRVRSDGSVETVGRDDLGLAQVPQAFAYPMLVKAHMAARPGVWEDTELIERIGGKVVAVPGDPANIHVVTRADLDLARAFYGFKYGPLT